MKTSIVISEESKQIMFTPENAHEKEMLQVFNTDDDINLCVRWGSFTNNYENDGYSVEICQGGYLRAWRNPDSVMLVIEPKKKHKQK